MYRGCREGGAVALGAKPEPVQNIERAMQVECPRDADGNIIGAFA
jgi:hypothetical protein